MRSLGLKPRWIAWRRRHTRGAGALLGVLLLAVLAGGALAVHYEARDAERGRALDRAAGRVFAAWVLAAHGAVQGHADAFETALETHVGILLTVARLRTLGAAPPGLPERPGRHAAMVLGVIADGTARGVPGRSPVAGRSPAPGSSPAPGRSPVPGGVPPCRWSSGFWNRRRRPGLRPCAPALLARA